MSTDRAELKRRYLENLEKGRELAARLAVEAEQVADTLEQLATVHEELARMEGHPLARLASERAAGERAMAKKERESSQRFRELASRPTGEGSG